MIFVTVGTHEQQFDRLVRCVDEMKRNSEILEDTVIQTGFSTFEPVSCSWSKFFPYQKMVSTVRDARIVITHGGPSSFIMPLQMGKVPIVMPRRKDYDEHVNDHQVDFCKAVAERFGNIIVADSEDELREAVLHYDEIVLSMPKELKSNNAKFNSELENLVRDIFKK